MAKKVIAVGRVSPLGENKNVRVEQTAVLHKDPKTKKEYITTHMRRIIFKEQ